MSFCSWPLQWAEPGPLSPFTSMTSASDPSGAAGQASCASSGLADMISFSFFTSLTFSLISLSLSLSLSFSVFGIRRTCGAVFASGGFWATLRGRGRGVWRSWRAAVAIEGDFQGLGFRTFLFKPKTPIIKRCLKKKQKNVIWTSRIELHTWNELET